MPQPKTVAPPTDWSAKLTRTVAGQVRRYRDARGMSAQQLADACEKLGYPIPRSVIANLESGRRESVSLSELLVLAAALHVSPPALVIPVDTTADVEILPGKSLPARQALAWFSDAEKVFAAGVVLREVASHADLIAGDAEHAA